MLINFTVSNYRSIREEQSLSLAKGVGNEHANNYVKTLAPATPEVLKSLAVYGPNASGKSNILLALRAMSAIVIHSASKGQSGDDIPVSPYLLSEETKSSPSEFEVDIVVDDVRYQYGFQATEARVIEEWLFSYPFGKAQQWFHRQWDENDGVYEWYMGKSLTGSKQLWQQSTRENALFLSTAVQLNSQKLLPVYKWFKDKLKITGIEGWDYDYSATLCKDESKKKVIVDFLRSADIDIEDISVKSEKFNVSDIPEELPDEVRKQIIEDLKNKEFHNVNITHQNLEGGASSMRYEDESDGTQKLFSLAGPWLDVLERGNVMFIDELNNSLHPKLVEFLVQLFHDPEYNKNNAQLVFTTHETSILSQDVFRRDQIWFCEKSDFGTRIFPLTEFRPKKGRENLEAAYLAGRYGAVPFVDTFL